MTKKYTSIEALTEDNDKVIYYDPDFDKTDYAILKKYKKQEESSSPEDFKQFLIDTLIAGGSDANLATREVDTLLLGKKVVEEGDFAVLVLTEADKSEKIGYYIRRDNNWIEVQSPIGENVLTDNKLFCNLQEQCITNTKQDKCNSLNTVKNQINEETLKAIYEEFDKTYGEKEDNLRDKIDTLF